MQLRIVKVLAMPERLICIMALILSCALLSSFQKAFSQVKRIDVEKVDCFHYRDSIKGHKIVIRVVLNDTTIATPANFYDLDALAGLPDSIKLVIVGKLLTFKNDQSICCRKVGKHYYDGIERTCIGRPKSQFYNMQVDALYMINKIVYPYGTSLYSCFPVIVDRESMIEINDRPELIADYFSVYERCFEKAWKSGEIGENFQFNTKKYAWFGAVEDTIK